MKNIQKKLTNYLKILADKVSRYSTVLFIIVFAALAGYLVSRIGSLSQLEPTQTQIDQKVDEVKKTTNNIDDIQKLKELEGRNISIEALFDNGRTNPFEN
jgi:hypothetical protein